MKKHKFKIGDKVVAIRRVTETGGPGNPRSKFPKDDYIHAEPGDVGKVVYLPHCDDCVTVRFIPKGSATDCNVGDEVVFLRDKRI